MEINLEEDKSIFISERKRLVARVAEIDKERQGCVDRLVEIQGIVDTYINPKLGISQEKK